MIKRISVNACAVVIVLISLISCGGAPYVHIDGQYNRDTETFKKGISDRSEVTICYAKRKTSPSEVTQLAVEECGRFGKKAQFTEQTLSVCPLATPMGAVFACLADSVERTTRR